MDLRGIGWEAGHWMHVDPDRDQWRPLVNTVMHLQIPQKAENFLTSWVTVRLSRKTLLHGVGYTCHKAHLHCAAMHTRLREMFDASWSSKARSFAHACKYNMPISHVKQKERANSHLGWHCATSICYVLSMRCKSSGRQLDGRATAGVGQRFLWRTPRNGYYTSDSLDISEIYVNTIYNIPCVLRIHTIFVHDILFCVMKSRKKPSYNSSYNETTI
jgi:hypothetical protein